MLTQGGSNRIKRYLAGFVPSIGQSIAFGIGSSAESNSSTRLDFEVGRENITLTSYDFVNNKLVFKAPVSESYSGKVYEVAIYSDATMGESTDNGSRMITTFDPTLEFWTVNGDGVTDSTFSTTNARVGDDGLSQAPATGTTKTDTLLDTSLDLSGYSASDLFTVALYTGNTYASAVKVVFATDASNYYTVNFGSAGAVGYKILSATKGSATATGTPTWESITEIRVQTTATGGTASVLFDGVRLESSQASFSDEVMVARDVLPVPFTKVVGTSQEIEYTLDVTA